MYRSFSDTELACQCGECGKGEAEMDPHFMTKVVALRTALGFPFAVSSAYRCPDHNDRVSSTGRSGPHTTGRSIDIRVRGEDAYRVITEAAKFGFTGIGVSQKGAHGARFIHLDDLDNETGQPRPWVWSY